MSCGWLPFWGSPAGYSFPNGRPSGKRSSSSYRPGGCRRCIGVRGVGSFFRTFGFQEVGAVSFRTLSGGCLSLHWQAWRGRGAETWVVEVLRLGYCLPSSALLMFHCSHPNALFQPHLHHGGCSGGGLRGLGCQGCYGACSTPFSRLLQPSVHSVVDLGVMAFGHHPLPSHSLCGRVTLSDGVHSVCAPVSTSGGLDGLHRSQGSVTSSAGSSCFSSLSSLHAP